MGLDSEWGSPAPEVVEGMGGNEIPCEGEQGGEPPGYWCSTASHPSLELQGATILHLDSASQP